jgi:hypothetical protein
MVTEKFLAEVKSVACSAANCIIATEAIFNATSVGRQHEAETYLG